MLSLADYLLHTFNPEDSLVIAIKNQSYHKTFQVALSAPFQPHCSYPFWFPNIIQTE